jgi:hypothetical protein
MKLAVGLFAILNGGFLLVNTIGLGMAGNAVTAGSAAASRIALAVLLAYGWALLKSTYNEVDLTPLFDSRSEAQLQNTETGLVAPPETVQDE